MCWLPACLGLLSVLSGGVVARAHDMWIVPPRAGVEVGALVAVPLRVGHGDQADSVRRNVRRIVRFTAVGPISELEVVGPAGAEPAGVFRPDSPGTWVVGYESTAAYSELRGERFERYLGEEGLAGISALRRQRGESAAAGRELYSRSLKSLFPVGAPSPLTDRRIGLPLELVVESSPTPGLASGRGTVTLCLYWRGEPLADVLVDLRRLDREVKYSKGRTDREGRVALPVAPGTWVAAAVHMEPANEGESEAEWRSWFATSTFGVE